MNEPELLRVEYLVTPAEKFRLDSVYLRQVRLREREKAEAEKERRKQVASEKS